MKNNNTYIFVRHAETQKDPRIPTVEWQLTDDALQTIHTLIAQGTFNDVSAIYTSSETKAIRTVEPITEAIHVQSSVLPDLGEVRRAPGFLSDEEFIAEKKKQLTDWDYKTPGSESVQDALARFSSALKQIDSTHTESTIVIVSHGTILSAFFAYLNKSQDAFTLWQNLPFCAVRIVEGEKVLHIVH